MGVVLTIITILLFLIGIGGTTYGIVYDTQEDYRVLVIAIIGLVVTVIVMFGLGLRIGKTRTVYEFGCKQSPTIVVNSTEYRCTP